MYVIFLFFFDFFGDYDKIFSRGDIMNKKLRSGMMLTLTAIVWGFAFVAQRVGGDQVGCYTYNALRYMLGALSLIPVFLLFEKQADDHQIRKVTLQSGVLCGILLFLATTLQQYGVMFTDYAGKAGFITDFYIILVPVFGLFLHQKTSKAAWLGVCLSLIGFYFLCMQTTLTINSGDALLFACAFFFAFHILAVDRVASHIYAIRFSFYQFLTIAFLSAIGAILFEHIPFESIKQAALPIAYGGLLSVGVGYTLQTLGQKGIDSTTAAILLSCESVFCALGSALILHEVMTMKSYFGCLLVFLGILLAQLSNNKK